MANIDRLRKDFNIRYCNPMCYDLRTDVYNGKSCVNDYEEYSDFISEMVHPGNDYHIFTYFPSVSSYMVSSNAGETISPLSLDNVLFLMRVKKGSLYEDDRGRRVKFLWDIDAWNGDWWGDYSYDDSYVSTGSFDIKSLSSNEYSTCALMFTNGTYGGTTYKKAVMYVDGVVVNLTSIMDANNMWSKDWWVASFVTEGGDSSGLWVRDFVVAEFNSSVKANNRYNTSIEDWVSYVDSVVLESQSKYVTYLINGYDMSTLYNTIVSDSRGVIGNPNLKDPVTSDIASENGVKFMSHGTYKAREIELDCVLFTGERGELQSQYNALLTNFYREGGAVMVIKAMPYRDLVYRVYLNGDMDFEKKWASIDNYGKFTLKLIETEPMDKEVYKCYAFNLNPSATTSLTESITLSLPDDYNGDGEVIYTTSEAKSMVVLNKYNKTHTDVVSRGSYTTAAASALGVYDLYIVVNFYGITKDMLTISRSGIGDIKRIEYNTEYPKSRGGE